MRIIGNLLFVYCAIDTLPFKAFSDSKTCCMQYVMCGIFSKVRSLFCANSQDSKTHCVQCCHFSEVCSIFCANSQDYKTRHCASTVLSMQCGVWGQTLAEVRIRSSLASCNQHWLPLLSSCTPRFACKHCFGQVLIWMYYYFYIE